MSKDKGRYIILAVTGALLLSIIIGLVLSRLTNHEVDKSLVSYVAGVVGSSWGAITLYYFGKDKGDS